MSTFTACVHLFHILIAVNVDLVQVRLNAKIILQVLQNKIVETLH